MTGSVKSWVIQEKEILCKTWGDLSHPDDVERAVAHVRGLVSGELDHYTIEKRYIRKDGSTVHTAIAVQAFYREDGTIDHIIGLMEDITARKQAEEALHQSEAKYRTLVEASPDAIIMGDPEGRITFASRRALEMYGTDNVEDLLGQEFT